jgi:LemA protein
MTALIVIIVILAIAVVTAWLVLRAGLVKKRNWVKESWSQINIELKRRHNLVPTLVSTSKEHIEHDGGTLDAVTKGREGAISAEGKDVGEISAAEIALSTALSSLFDLSENYPQLRADKSFEQVRETLVSTEDKIEYASKYYNINARDYNAALKKFPASLIAGLSGLKPAGYFKTAADELEAQQASGAGQAASEVAG